MLQISELQNFSKNKGVEKTIKTNLKKQLKQTMDDNKTTSAFNHL